MQSCIEVQTGRPKLVPSYISASAARDLSAFSQLRLPVSRFLARKRRAGSQRTPLSGFDFVLVRRRRTARLPITGLVYCRPASFLPPYIVFAFCVQRSSHICCLLLPLPTMINLRSNTGRQVSTRDSIAVLQLQSVRYRECKFSSYLRQGGYVSLLFVCLLATLGKKTSERICNTGKTCLGGGRPTHCPNASSYLWPPALRNRTGHYIFALWFLSSIYLSFFIPRLISAATYWMSTILLHMAWP